MSEDNDERFVSVPTGAEQGRPQFKRILLEEYTVGWGGND